MQRILLPVILLRGFRESPFVFILRMGGQFALDFLDSLNQQFHLGFLFPFLIYRGYWCGGFQLVGIGAGKVKRQLCGAGTDQLIFKASRPAH